MSMYISGKDVTLFHRFSKFCFANIFVQLLAELSNSPAVPNDGRVKAPSIRHKENSPTVAGSGRPAHVDFCFFRCSAGYVR